MTLTAQLSLAAALAGPPPEPCVNCEQPAAANWLLCLECATKLDEAMLIRLTRKFVQLGAWLVQAEEALRDMPKGEPKFIEGWDLWQRKFRVHQRLDWLGQAVKGAA